MSVYYEGTKDYVLGTLALISSFKASGSITAGKLVAFDLGGTTTVYQPTVAKGGIKCAGVALATVSSADNTPVLTWGYAKNLACTNASETVAPGYAMTISGSGGFTSGSTRTVATFVSGSASRFTAFINCMTYND